MALKTILVGVDGSHASNAAVRWAIELAELLGARLIALHSLGLLSSVPQEGLVPTEGHRRAIVEEFENDWCAPIHQSGVSCKTVIVDGNPVSAILAVSEEENVDLVVLGSRGHSVTGVLLGSTSHQVAERSRCPVVIIPPKAALD